MSRIYLCLSFLLISTVSIAQKATIFGTVTDYDTRESIELAIIFTSNSNVTESDLKGLYRIEVPSEEEVIISISRVGYQDATLKIQSMPSGVKRNINFKMVSTTNNLEIVITESKIEDVGMAVSYTHLTLPTKA